MDLYRECGPDSGYYLLGPQGTRGRGEDDHCACLCRNVALYGGVPLLKHSVAANEEMHYPRNTFAETVDYIVQLLDEAAPALEWKASVRMQAV